VRIIPCVLQGQPQCGAFLTLWFRKRAGSQAIRAGPSGTRRVPAPSHLAQRDAAKTQTTPREFWPNASGAKRIKQAEIHLANVSIWKKQKWIDSTKSVPEIRKFLNTVN